MMSSLSRGKNGQTLLGWMWISKILESAISKAVKSDADSFELLKPLEEQVIAVEIIDLPLRTVFWFSNNRCHIRINTSQEAHVTLRGRSVDLYGFLKEVQTPGAFQRFHLKATGNIEILQKLQIALKKLNLDWESLFCETFGNRPGVLMSQIIRRISNVMKLSCKSTSQDLNEFLQEESRLLAPITLWKDFKTDLLQLRQDLDRLEARLKFYSLPTEKTK